MSRALSTYEPCLMYSWFDSVSGLELCLMHLRFNCVIRLEDMSDVLMAQ